MLLFLILLLTFSTGCFVAGVALHDPDTCWQLALGKLILESGSIIRTDPFSYTFIPDQSGHDFVMYQWLSNLIFYATYKTVGIFGLLCLTAEVLALSFIIIPICRAKQLGTLKGLVFWCVLLSTFSASFHFLARPEIWSYFFMAVILVISFELTKSRISFGWKYALTIVLLMLAWCNLHSGFVLGILLLAVQALCNLIDHFRTKSKPDHTTYTIFSCLLAAIVASLFNPYGLTLWTYLPKLFFSDFNKYIVELKPLSIADMTSVTFLPYIALAIIGVLTFGQSIKDTELKTTKLFPPVALILAIGAGIGCRRLVPFSALIESMVIIQFLISAKPIRRSINIPVMALLTVLSVAAGVYWTSTRDTIKISIPQSSIVFVPPMKAVEHLKTKLPAGNLLNDPQFGDVLILHMDPVPKLFIDTRFDMYGSKLVRDYHQMVKCEDNFESKLEQYKINWVFLHPNEKLVAYLEQNPNWKVVFKDDAGAIIVRQ